MRFVWIMGGVLLCTMALGPDIIVALTWANQDPIPVSDFDREEIRSIHNAAQSLIDRRNILISHTAKRHNVNLEEYDYDIEKGVFFATDITSPDTDPPDSP